MWMVLLCRRLALKSNRTPMMIDVAAIPTVDWIIMLGAGSALLSG